jgi:glutamate racemase
MSTLGIFDSGLGGLTVVQDIKKRFPNCSVVYLGDTARVPYGPRGNEVITEFALQDVEFLQKFPIDAVVIACNTVSAVAADAIRKAVSVPVYEMIAPAAKQARAKTRNGRVGVIGTRATIASHAYKKQLEGLEVFEQACPLFVPFVEEGELESEALVLLAKEYLRPLQDADIDTLILGCTHYPLIRKIIQEVMGDDVALITCGEAVAEELASLGDDGGEDHYFVTDCTPRYDALAKKIMGENIHLEKCVL